MTSQAFSLGHHAELDAPPRIITIPYSPRPHFVPMHNSPKRWIFNCSHRRAGKTVALCNKIIRAAVNNSRPFPVPRYAYIGPSFTQTKDIVWSYFKHYTSPLPGVEFHESELKCTLPNKAIINLYGGAMAYERMRGVYFDGAVLDEFPLINPTAFTSVVRPCLSDYRGWAVVAGSSAGDDHFSALRMKHLNDPDWDIFVIPVTDTDVIPPDELEEMRKIMSPEEYAREMLCDFSAPVEGAYYAYILNEQQALGRVTGVPWDSHALVTTSWDLGIDDETAIWFFQHVGREIHVIDYYASSGVGLEHYADVIRGKPYSYGCHVLPHDVEARELGTGRSRKEVLGELLQNIVVCPSHTIEDGINATRGILRLCWFDEKATAPGFQALRNYHRGKTGKPAHDWSSHAADSFRYFAVSQNYILSVTGSKASLNRPLRRRIRGLCR